MAQQNYFPIWIQQNFKSLSKIILSIYRSQMWYISLSHRKSNLFRDTVDIAGVMMTLMRKKGK